MLATQRHYGTYLCLSARFHHLDQAFARRSNWKTANLPVTPYEITFVIGASGISDPCRYVFGDRNDEVAREYLRKQMSAITHILEKVIGECSIVHWPQLNQHLFLENEFLVRLHVSI